MTNVGEESRSIGACVECGSMYAVLELPDGKIQPIGSRNGCTSCGGTEFVCLSQFSDDSETDETDAT